MGWLVAGLILMGLASVPWLNERRRYDADVFRKKAPGRFAKLSQGVTHYQWVGAETGPVVVCAHGLTTPSPVWYAIAQGLGQMGFRVLLYDLYGRGFSDAPDGVQDGDFFAQQLADLLDHQNITVPVTLMGYSMGGSVVSHFTAQTPDRVARLVLLAPGGMWLREDRLTAFCRRVPVLGDWLFQVIATRQERQALRAQLGKAFDIPGIIELQLAEYQSRGFLRAVLSSRRNILADVQKKVHKDIARAGVPVLAIWAEKDEVIPLKSLGTLTQWNNEVAHKVIPLADHRVAYCNAAQVIAILDQQLQAD